MIREFHLSPSGKGGVSCDADGVFVGAIPVLTRLHKNGKDEWHPRDCAQLSKQMGAVYGLPIDISSKRGGLRAIANALNQGDVARAQIATVLLGIPDPPQLSKRAGSHDQMIKLIRDLNWSGLLKWDSDKHPRWPAGSADSKGGEFAPKDEGAGTTASPASQSKAGDRTKLHEQERSRQTNSGNGNLEPDTASRSPRIQLADVGRSDAANDPVAQAAARAAAAVRQDHDTANTVLAAAEGGDEEEPRFGMGHNGPPEELIPERLQQSPAGPPLQFLDNLLGITAPAEELNLGLTELEMQALLHGIHEVDPNYIYESIEPPGGLAGMSWRERANVINRLRADLAAAIYRAHGNIRPLQEVTLDFMQRATNDAYDEAVQRYNAGRLNVWLSREEAIGNYVDARVRGELRDFFNGLRIPTGPGSIIQVNNRAYNSSATSYRVPDARVGNLAFDMSLTPKSRSSPQIKGFFNADFKPIGVVIIRPNQLGNRSSYVIWRLKGN